MEKLLNKFGYFKKKKPAKQYKEIRYKQPGTTEENSQHLIELTVQGN